ncbi:MAG TPA: SMC-Scp complex subunit ScpB [Candidatus Omnitrophica bacterium]|nr:SMC-Scp complex subunit ScpB [Candidatus Omnitrophota bacterium]
MKLQQLKPIVEALLFCSSSPLKAKRIKEILNVDSATIRKVIEELNHDYEEEGRSFYIRTIAGGYQFYLRSEFSPYVKELQKRKPIKLSSPALETLAMVAYRQPITRPEIEDIRGVESKGVLKNLMEKNFIRIVGKKNVPGRPILYGTTAFFLKHFGLNSISDLPKIEEFAAHFSEVKEEESIHGHPKTP